MFFEPFWTYFGNVYRFFLQSEAFRQFPQMSSPLNLVDSIYRTTTGAKSWPKKMRAPLQSGETRSGMVPLWLRLRLCFALDRRLINANHSRLGKSAAISCLCKAYALLKN